MKRNKTIHNQDYSSLVDQLSLERRRLGLSQAEVADCLGMTQSEISKIETAERRLDVLEFKQLLEVYRIKDNKALRQLVANFLEIE